MRGTPGSRRAESAGDRLRRNTHRCDTSAGHAPSDRKRQRVRTADTGRRHSRLGERLPAQAPDEAPAVPADSPSDSPPSPSAAGGREGEPTCSSYKLLVTPEEAAAILSVGRTTPDDGCNIRLTARQLYAFGQQRAALALMCQDSRVAEAMAAVGESCVIAPPPNRPRRAQRIKEEPVDSWRRTPGRAHP